MTIRQFIKNRSLYDDPIGDLAKDVLHKESDIIGKSERQILEYLEFETSRNGIGYIYQEFLAEYRKRENKTLGLILKYLSDNEIESIESALEKQVAMSFTELCGYLIKIPVKNDFPETVIKDLGELETMNPKYIPISDGSEVHSTMITSPNINDGVNITFCCQEEQFDFLLSLNRKI